MTPPRPLTAADREMLARVIAQRWPGCCREAQASPTCAQAAPFLDADGSLLAVYWQTMAEADHALSLLADDLEGDSLLCLDIERTEGQPPRVLGWATWFDASLATRRRLVDLDPWHPAREARDTRLLEERTRRRGGRGVAAPNAKLGRRYEDE